MVQSGNLVLINATPYAWQQTNVSSAHMSSWSFPTTVPPSTRFSSIGVVTAPLTCKLLEASVNVHVEWNEEEGPKDIGEVYYALEGTQHSFQIHAKAPAERFNIHAFFDGIATTNNPQGSTIGLKWKRDNSTSFVLGGTPGEFFSSNPPTNWMQSTLSSIGNRPLRHIAMPGSHDAGMSTITGGTAFGTAEDSQTQTQSIGQQLALGSRYFDIRPVITDGFFAAGHYSDIDVLGWQGANGQKISDIIAQINSFTANNKELVILNLSHDLNTDVGRDYRSLNQGEWNSLFQQLLGINNLFVAANPTTVDLTTMTLNQFISGNRAAVLIIVQPSDSSITLGSFVTRGFYTYSQFNAYNSYSDTDDLDTMTSDQLNKMRSVRNSPDSQLFLLSWTLTQDAGDIFTFESILDLADEANAVLMSDLLPAVSHTTFPNIIYIDNFADSSVTALAMSINSMTS